jgi:phosphoribosylformylglycinamidine synthase
VFLAKIYVTLKPTVNDPQGQTVLAALKTLGFESAKSVRMGKYLEVQVEEPDRHRAEAQVQAMCDKLLANPVIEEFRYELT